MCHRFGDAVHVFRVDVQLVEVRKSFYICMQTYSGTEKCLSLFQREDEESTGDLQMLLHALKRCLKTEDTTRFK